MKVEPKCRQPLGAEVRRGSTLVIMADREEKVAQFSAVAGVDTERATFFLESAAWNLESALSSFYEQGDEEEAAGGRGGGSIEDLGERPQVEGAPGPPQRPPSDSAIQRALVNIMDQDSDSSGNEEEDGQAFYAGGSEHSGQQVLGPPRKKSDMVTKLFKSAKEHGAEVLESERSGKKPKKLTFGGTGYRLGLTPDDTEVIPDNSKKEERPRDVSLKMWRTGFTVDDGPLRAYEDPTNAEFLNSIRRSEVPLELIREARGGEVYINMADHRHEDYAPPKVSLRAFSGAGHTLGSLAPTVVGQQRDLGASGGTSGGASGGASSQAAQPQDSRSLQQTAQEALKVDETLPVTSIQLRMPDGSRLVARMNHTHTVGDIRHFVQTVQPTYHTTDYGLMTTFPFAELTNLSQTVSEAKLLNSAIVIKTK
ncbi:NSFL1 cofactor p47-like isoform X2 [Eriocheir sinensis]|uniref:NSFL1 cofactor p47-like isoform X2 n=1 Tax=Eriocheir sinensis TaxID=95602 RepID=UPI0021C815CC|nr:NSFL1 cofactor p47-like isoform X2 [Eriocheir sinensis]